MVDLSSFFRSSVISSSMAVLESSFRWALSKARKQHRMVLFSSCSTSSAY